MPRLISEAAPTDYVSEPKSESIQCSEPAAEAVAPSLFLLKMLNLFCFFYLAIFF